LVINKNYTEMHGQRNIKFHLELISEREESRKYNFSFLKPVAAIERLHSRTRTYIQTIEALPLQSKSTCRSIQNW